MWLNGARIREGQDWFTSVLDDFGTSEQETVPAIYARVLTDKAILDVWAGAPASMDQAREALEIARRIDDPVLLCRALTTCGFIAGNTDGPHIAQRYFAEGVALARSLRDTEILRQIRLWQGNVAFVAAAADCGEYVLGLAESAMAVTAPCGRGCGFSTPVGG